jgi:K+:H+ antiporter
VAVHDAPLIPLVTIGLAFALLFGSVTNRLGLSPIVGYLLAGVMIGPSTPGFVGDVVLARQLAEIGVILLMFGVGLHFDLSDLLRVRSTVLPGAATTIVVATTSGLLLGLLVGLPFATSFLLGVSVSIASTVVLVRVLSDCGVLHTPQGHVAVGWLVVEDLFTVIILVLLPALVESSSPAAIARSLGLSFLKILSLVFVVLVIGRRVVPELMSAVARTRSRELFTLSVLVVALGVAAGSAAIFQVSMALGAFLAGMVVGRSDVGHQAASDALPMRDAFAVLFFISVGMLFDLQATLHEWKLLIGLLLIIFFIKPLAAFTIVKRLGHSNRTALTVALALGQIGEFTFILGEVGRSLALLTHEQSSVLVSCAIVTITLNPLAFRRERWLERLLDRWRTSRGGSGPVVEPTETTQAPQAVVVGYGPVGRTLTRLLREFGVDPVIIDQNVDTIRTLKKEGVRAVFGDAESLEILHAAGIEKAQYLCMTLPDRAARYPIIALAQTMAPQIRVLVRARYIGEKPELERAGVTATAFEEAEVAVALAELLLKDLGVSEEEVNRRANAIRTELAVHPR